MKKEGKGRAAELLQLTPLAAYPLREPFRIGAERSEGQRSTALVYGVW